jgi:hypothetical protein
LAGATQDGAWKIDVLHFDACLMSMIEVAYQVKGYAHYMIASQNLTASFYPYDRYASKIIRNPNIEPRQFAQEIAETYFAYDYLRVNSYPRTVSVLDLGYVVTATNAISTFISALSATLPGGGQAISQALTSAQHFDSSPPFYTIDADDDYVDLRHLAQQFITSSNPAVANAAIALDSALAKGSGLVVDNWNESGRDILVSNNAWALDNANGVAIFFPQRPGVWDYAAYLSNTVFSFTANVPWGQFLHAYHQAISAPTVTLSQTELVPPVIKPTQPITNHCLGNRPCMWGAVYSNGLPLKGVTVTLDIGSVANATASSSAVRIGVTTTDFITGSEAYPIFVLPVSAADNGKPITVTAIYGNKSEQRIGRLALGSNNEQAFDITFGDEFTETQAQAPDAPQVAINLAFVSPVTATQYPTQTVVFYANAGASDRSDVVAYSWQSSLDGDLGTSADLVIPAARLSNGEHTISVTALGESGTRSQTITRTLNVRPLILISVSSVTPNPVTQWPTATVTFSAGATASDNSTIARYEWTSNLLGALLGTASSFSLPASALPPGQHVISVVAVNQDGIRSEPMSTTLTVNPIYVSYFPMIQKTTLHR